MNPSIPLATLAQDGPSEPRGGERALLLRQLSVVREMLGTFDTVTIAGQRHVMDKVIAFVEEQIRHAGTHVSQRNQATLADLMTHIRSESERLSPDSARFAQRAESLISLLVAIG